MVRMLQDVVKKYPDKCPNCNYKPKSYTNFLQHTLQPLQFKMGQIFLLSK